MASSVVPSVTQHKHDSVAWSQNYFMHQSWLVPIYQLQLEVPENFRNGAFHLKHGELLSDAVSRTRAEWNISVSIFTRVLSRESFWDELFGVLENLRIATHQ